MNNPLTKIGRLKNKLRRHYLHATSYKNYLDCGAHMAKILNPNIILSERKFNDVADQLKELGEPVPDFRFSAKEPR